MHCTHPAWLPHAGLGRRAPGRPRSLTLFATRLSFDSANEAITSRPLQAPGGLLLLPPTGGLKKEGSATLWAQRRWQPLLVSPPPLRSQPTVDSIYTRFQRGKLRLKGQAQNPQCASVFQAPVGFSGCESLVRDGDRVGQGISSPLLCCEKIP
jgi:hypothetical protein